MNIQPISFMSNPRVQFSGEHNKRKKATDRAATVQDLYEMEDRINARNGELIKKQNELIGKTLRGLIDVTYLSPTNEEDLHEDYSAAITKADLLIHNGVLTI